MSKKITSLLVVLTVVLFTLPTQAQTTFKAQKTPAGSVKVIKGNKAVKISDLQKAKSAKAIALAKDAKAAEAEVEGLSFAQAKQSSLIAPAEKSPVADAFTPSQWFANASQWAHPQSAILKSVKQNSVAKNFVGYTIDSHKTRGIVENSLLAKVNGPLKAATTDSHGIITAADEGETKYYTRAGTAFYVASNSVSSEDQSGIVTIVEAEGGKVYIKDPVSHYSQGTWVEGTKDGNTITVAAGQPLAWNSNYSTTLSLYWANVQSSTTGNTYVKDGETTTITFTVDDEAGTITLDGSSTDKIIAVFWDDDNSWSGYGDYGTVWTLNTEYEPASTDPIVLPDGAEVQNWYADGTGSAAVPTDVKVAFVGNEVYISGLTSNFPDAWIKGTIDGTTVTFSKFQFVGMYNNTMPIWAVGADSDTGNLQDFTMTFDSEAQTLTLDENQLLVFNAAEDRMYYLSYIESLTIYAEKPAPAQIDVLPYVNSFDDAAEQKHFSIIDANEDGRTWNWYSGMARYTYHQTNQGDDWLVSPAIKLVAGKKYAFSIAAHAQSASYPERIEVKAAQENTAEALAAGTQVLPSTDVTTPGFVTYENNEFTVTESGYYYIGVHAISDADKYYLYVDDFSIDAAPIAAPYTADFSQAGSLDDFGVIDNNGDGKTWAWSASNGAYYNYNSSAAADDYLILPIKLEAGKNYNVTVTAAAASSSYPEKFEVVAGKGGTVADLTTTVIAETTVATATDTEYTGILAADEAGTYYVAIHATSDADQYQLRVKKFVIEVGAEATAPAAVGDLAVVQTPDQLEATISFTAPTKSVAGEDLTANLTKIEVLRNGEVVKTLEDIVPGSAQNVVDAVPEVGTYVYQVIPYNADGIGEKSEEVSILISTSLNVPYTFDLTENLIDLFQVIDANEDDKTWGWSASYGTYYSYSSTNQADDYLISAPFNLVAGKNYLVTVAASSYSASYPERFEVLVGKVATVDGLTQTVIPATDVASNVSEDFEGDFTVAEDGQYYIAIHAISDADKWRLNIQKLAIEAGAEPTAPAAVADLTATAGAEGALEVNLAFTAPAKAINGTDLTGTVDINIYRDNALVNTLADVAIGSAQTYQDTDVEDGKTYTYYIKAANASGEGPKSEKVSTFVGTDAVAGVDNFQASNVTPTNITFTWDPATGANGGYVNTAAIDYTIYPLHVEIVEYLGYEFEELVADDPILTVKGETTATIDFNTLEGEQDYKYFGISASDGTVETDPVESYTYVLVGAPEELPIEEGFAGNTLHYNWEANGGLGVDSESSDGDGTALRLYNNGTSSEVFFALPRVNLATAANPTIIFDAKNGVNVSKVKVIGSADGADYQVLGEFNLTSDYTAIKQALSSIKGTNYSAVGLLATIPTVSETQYEDYVVIDNIRIVDLYEYDLSVKVNAPANVLAGNAATITATVKNEGENAASGYTVVIKAGDKELLNKTVNESLAPFAKTEFTAEFATTVFDDAADVTITAEVIYNNDLNEDNNSAETVFSIKESTAAQPENVTATDKGNEGVEITWTAPDNSSAETTEDFASYENGADEDGELGDWTLINANGHTKGGIFQDTSLASDGLVRAWQVFNLATYGGDNSAFAGPDGEVDNNYLISTYNLENSAYPGNDDWLISPVLPGVAQTLTFDVKAFNDYGAQTYQVLYSTTGKETADFELIEEVADNGGAWANKSFNLPEGTKYFAIRNITGGDEGFILAVDNINFLTGGSDATGYNIYYEGELIATVEGDVTTYTVAAEKIAAGERTFAVSAVYANGQESKPVPVTVEVTTAIKNIVVSDSKPADVYSLDGKLVRQQAKSLDGLKGVYVVNGKAVIVK